MTYDQKHVELQKDFLEKFELFHKLDEEASDGEKNSAAYLKVKEEFEKINIEYQDFLMMFKDTDAKGTDELGVVGERCDT